MYLMKKMYVLPAAAAVILVAGIMAGSLWSDHKIDVLEREAATAREKANVIEKSAALREQRAVEYKAKIEYLEGKLAEISAKAREQDEELQKVESDTNAARNGVERARRARSVRVGVGELCGKLSELGHPCG